MKVFEFKSKIKNHTIKIPREIESDKFSEKEVKVILLYEETNEEHSFERITTSEFLEGYDNSDAIYDEA
ncbi:MAG: hypothetical protein AAF363_13275 [Bacteroidota bacterium]